MNPYRQNDLSQFLQYLTKLYIQNPNLPILNDTIYHELTRFDCPDDYGDDLKCKFPKWVELFKKSHLKVYNHPEQSHFLQFYNNRGKATDDYFAYKLYLNVPGFYIDEAVKKIFGFMNRMNIETYSKVADKVRSDCIVLRIPNKNDMLTVLDFINNDVMLKCYARKTNPFMMSFGVVGSSYDKLEGYNGTVSKLLTQYFQEKRKSGALNSVDLKDFQNFVLNLQRTIFTDHQAMMKFFNQQGYAVYRRFHSCKEEQILNYKEIIDLIALNITRDVTLNEYVNLVEKYRNREWERQELELIKQVYADRRMESDFSYKEDTQMGYQTERIYEQEKETSKKVLIDEYIKYAIKKYGVKISLNYLDNFMSGNIEGITRDNNFRARFRNEITPDDVLEVANYDTATYCARVYILNNTYKYNLIIAALSATYKKYGYEQLAQAVVSALNGNFSLITEGGLNKYRDRMIESCVTHDIRNVMESFLLSNNITFTDYNLATVFASSLSKENDLSNYKKM